MFTLLVYQECLQMVRSNEAVRRILGAIADSLPAVLNRWVITSHKFTVQSTRRERIMTAWTSKIKTSWYRATA